ncbi:MAG: c-type cytochrome biogenesis protein CcmI [Marinibacterium sp.]
MLFWIISTLLALAVAILFVLALMRGRGPAEPPAAYDLRVYRDQLKEVDRDLARGVIAQADAERARVEISRRILAADAQVQKTADQGGGPRRLGIALSAVLILGMAGGAVLLYRQLGAPGYADLPRQSRIAAAEAAHEERPSQAKAEAEIPPDPPRNADPQLLDLMAQLRDRVAQTPDDIRGQRLLAQYEYALGNFVDAYHAQSEVIRLAGDAATSQDFSSLAEMMILAAGGYVSPEAETALDRALALDENNGAARFFQGLMLAQVGRPDLAFNVWDRLLRTSAPDAPWVAPIEAQIGDMARLAGVEYEPVARPALPGPDADAVAAAQDMTPEERAQMISGMVDRLANRLATEGGTVAEWARLISVLGVQGDTERAARIYAEARSKFGDTPEAMAQIDAAARQAGVAGEASAGAPALPGPSREDVEAAQDMTPEERAQMIQSMVERLETRLAEDGGQPQEWVRLIGALGVLNDPDRAAAALARARAAYAGDPQALAMFDDAADRAGISR